MDQRRKRCAEKHQQHNVRTEQQDILSGKEPADRPHISQTQRQRRKAYQQRRDRRTQEIAAGQDRTAYRRNGQILPGAGDLVLYHQHIGTERHSNAADRKNGRNELRPDSAVDQLLRKRKAVRKICGKRIPVNTPQKSRIQHQQNCRRDKRSEKHSLVLEIQLDVTQYHGFQHNQHLLSSFLSQPGIHHPFCLS